MLFGDRDNGVTEREERKVGTYRIRRMGGK